MLNALPVHPPVATVPLLTHMEFALEETIIIEA